MAEVYKAVNHSTELYYFEHLSNQEPEESSPVKADEQSIEKTANLQEQAREKGYNLGFKQGLSEGLEKAKKQIEKENDEQRLQLIQLLKAIPSAINENRLSLKSEIADFVLAITERFFIEQQQNKQAIAQQISSALHLVNDKQSLTLVLNPKDLTLLQKGELKIDFSLCQNLRIVADENLALGGCLIRSEHGVFDAGIEGQIERLKQALLQIKTEATHG